MFNKKDKQLIKTLTEANKEKLETIETLKKRNDEVAYEDPFS